MRSAGQWGRPTALNKRKGNTVGKMNTKERARFQEAEGHLRAAFGDTNIVCLWEISKPTNTTMAILAGFAVAFHGQRHYVILQVYRDGAGWEVFGCPSTLKIEPTFDAPKTMWRAHLVTGAPAVNPNKHLCGA